jgi:zinc D-Ala-D-Ala dipeptidase
VSLVEITPESHDVRIDLKYATSDNFTGKPVYRKGAGCYLHADAAEKLKVAVGLAKTQGYRFTIYDAFRPSEVQWKLWEHTPDPNFLANPAKGSPHSRGVAVDLTLCRWDFTPLDMGTGFDEFHPRSHHGRLDVDAQAQRNRLLLMGIMTTAGWDFYRNEWWHYQLFNSRSYPLYADADAPAPVMA